MKRQWFWARWLPQQEQPASDENEDGRRLVTITVLVGAALGIVFLLGPRVPVDTTVTFDPQAIGPDPEAHLARREKAITGIRPGLQKEIVWADPTAKRKSRLSVVYVHGFSA